MIINKLQLIDFKPELSGAFKTLNQWWIESYFVMEKADYELLDHPQEAIIDKGGIILFAMAGKHPVGVCALIKSKIATYDFELAKKGFEILASRNYAQSRDDLECVKSAILEKGR